MINIQEIISSYVEQGYSREGAFLMAKSDLSKKSKSLNKSNNEAELKRISEYTPKNKKHSVVYGARKGVM